MVYRLAFPASAIIQFVVLLITLLQEKKMQLKGSKTHENLKAAFAGESMANRRYLYFAAKADVEGQNDVSAVFRSTAEGRFLGLCVAEDVGTL